MGAILCNCVQSCQDKTGSEAIGVLYQYQHFPAGPPKETCVREVGIRPTSERRGQTDYPY
jgi:sulfur relay (sulfurtransferase) DsrC/TusE family protein